MNKSTGTTAAAPFKTWALVCVMAWGGQASTHAEQKTHLPKSSETRLPGSRTMAWVGHAGTHAAQLSAHFAASTRNAPP
jgi:hypothetical protein